MALLKSLATVSGMTLASRVFGLARQLLLAGALGASGNPAADAFNAAFRLPNMFRRLLAEGAFHAAFVPLYSGKLENEGAKAAHAFAENVMAWLLVITVGLTAVAQLFMPVVILGLASGFRAEPDKYDLAIAYGRIMFPYIIAMSLVGMMAGMLNAFNRFFVASAAPVLLNLIAITALLWPAEDQAEAGRILSCAIALGGVAQLAALYYGCRRSGLNLKLRIPRFTPEVGRLVALGVPGFVAAGAMQINLVVSTNIASQQPGAVSWLSYADMLYQLPLAVIGIAIGVVLLPTLSRRAQAGDNAGASDALNRALELAMLFALPAAAALVVMPELIIGVLFRDLPALLLGASAFGQYDTERTGDALAAFSLGLPAYVLVRVFSPAFFAREDTRTPMLYALIGVGLNTALAIALFFRIGYLGVAVATSVAAWFNAIMLAVRLAVQGHFTPDARLTSRLPRIILAAALMGAGLLWLARRYAPLGASTEAPAWLLLLIFIPLGGAVYGALCLAFGVARPSDLRAALSGRTDPSSQSETPSSGGPVAGD